MEKYNNGNSISFETISEKELEMAFKEFAEGNEHLEKLLKECHNMDVATTGSHAGPTGQHKGQDVNGPYLEFDILKSSKKIENILNSIKDEKGFDIMYYPDANANIFARKDTDIFDFDKPTLAIGFNQEENEDRINKLFDKMSNSVKEKEIGINGPFGDLLDIFKKFTGKVSGVYFQVFYNENGYKLRTVIDQGIDNPNAEYLKSIFSNTGLILDESEIAKKNEKRAYLYELNCEDIEAFGKEISRIKEAVRDLQIELPSFDSEKAKKLKVGYKATILKRDLIEKYGDSEKAREEMEKYLIQENVQQLFIFYKHKWFTDERYQEEKNKLFSKYTRLADSGKLEKMIEEFEKKASYDYEQKQVKDSIKEKVKQIQELEEKSNQIDSQNIELPKNIK